MPHPWEEGLQGNGSSETSAGEADAYRANQVGEASPFGGCKPQERCQGRSNLGVRGYTMTDIDRTAVQRALDNHSELRYSYFWTNLGNAGQRRSREKQLNFSVTIERGEDVYTYNSCVRISTRNFYYTGVFAKNGKRGDVRIFKQLLK